jgi:polyisoprenoid-binding protein YceI
MRPLLLCLGLAAVNAVAAASVESEILSLDPVRSHAGFEVKVMWLIGVHGDFGALHGTLAIDHFRNTAVVDASIDANDVHMRSRNYETWARSNEFFDSKHYPQIHFVSEPFALPRLVNGGDIDGSLTLRGIHRRVRFAIEPSTCRDMLAGACPTEAAGTIQRSDFGMRSRRGTLADKVELRLSIYVPQVPAEPTP